MLLAMRVIRAEHFVGKRYHHLLLIPFMRFRLRTLLIALAVGPPLLALEWWYWKESAFALVALEVVSLYVILWLLYLILWMIERIYDALCQLIGVKPHGVHADDSK
jgi:hypothetical protein